MLIFVTIGVGTAAFNTGQNILYLALSMLLSTLLVSGILSWINFKGCRWRLETGRHFRAGESSPVYLDLDNTKKRLPSYSLTFTVTAIQSDIRENLSLEQRLDPGKSVRLLWDFIPQKRGPETLSLKGLVSRYPFGFLRKSISDSFTRDIIVWPARVNYQFAADKSGQRWMYGHHRRKGDGVDLIHLREYRSGDSLKRIHWKASARMGSLQVRETEQEHHQAFTLWIDPSPRIWADAQQFERMCAFAASLGEDLFQKDQLRCAEVAGGKRIAVGAIEDLYSFLDELGALEREVPRTEGSQLKAPEGAIRFVPGAAGTVVAVIEEGNIGQA
jgi:uncharacterized protein (DUF58 family)